MRQPTITGKQSSLGQDDARALRFPVAFTPPDGTNHPPITRSITGIPANDAGSDGMMESASLSANTSQPDGKALPDRIKTCSVLPSDLIISAIHAAADGRTESASKFPGCYPMISASDLVAAFAATAKNAATGFPFCFKRVVRRCGV